MSPCLCTEHLNVFCSLVQPYLSMSVGLLPWSIDLHFIGIFSGIYNIFILCQMLQHGLVYERNFSEVIGKNSEDGERR